MSDQPRLISIDLTHLVRQALEAEEEERVEEPAARVEARSAPLEAR